MPATLLVREVRYTLTSKGQRSRVITLATTLLDEKRYSKEELARLYGLCWRVETHFGQLKTTLKMRSLKCKTVEGIRKELAVYCLVYNLIHRRILQAAARQEVAPERLSFTDALWDLWCLEPGEDPDALLVNPLRPDRHEPRAVKAFYNTYRRLTRPRDYFQKHPELCNR